MSLVLGWGSGRRGAAWPCPSSPADEALIAAHEAYLDDQAAAAEVCAELGFGEAVGRVVVDAGHQFTTPEGLDRPDLLGAKVGAR